MGPGRANPAKTINSVPHSSWSQRQKEKKQKTRLFSRIFQELMLNYFSEMRWPCLLLGHPVPRTQDRLESFHTSVAC